MSPRCQSAAWPALFVAACLCLIGACAARRPVRPELTAAADRHDALAVSDALEALIDAQEDTIADRQYAYDTVHAYQDDTAPVLYARASVTGRLVQQKGLLGAHLVPEIERCARRSRDLDPDFRAGAATRLLGTLYVLAPAAVLQQGDSETGLELLESLVQRHPEAVENHLRLAEAYMALGDPAPAGPYLCRCLAHDTALHADDQRLLRQLVKDAGTPRCVPTTGGAP
ncbi:MAG: hypothetical protein U0587_03450 [Candidatus Binatia bacterium]